MFTPASPLLSSRPFYSKKVKAYKKNSIKDALKCWSSTTSLLRVRLVGHDPCVPAVVAHVAACWGVLSHTIFYMKHRQLSVWFQSALAPQNNTFFWCWPNIKTESFALSSPPSLSLFSTPHALHVYSFTPRRAVSLTDECFTRQSLKNRLHSRNDGLKQTVLVRDIHLLYKCEL